MTKGIAMMMMMMMMVSEDTQRQRSAVIRPASVSSVHNELHECDRKRSSSHWLSLNVAQLQNNQEKVC